MSGFQPDSYRQRLVAISRALTAEADRRPGTIDNQILRARATGVLLALRAFDEMWEPEWPK